LFWNFPKIFGKAACLSNSFWVNDRKIFSMVKEVNNEFNEKNRLYIDCGTGEKELLGDYKKMVALIKSLSTNDKNFFHHLEEGSRHTEYDWAQRLHIPLKFLFGKNQSPNIVP
jgi:predicted alpha/beta superfamily hydrolase